MNNKIWLKQILATRESYSCMISSDYKEVRPDLRAVAEEVGQDDLFTDACHITRSASN